MLATLLGMSEALPHDAFLPTTRAELEARGWDEVDVVLVSGDAYLDHPSFANALLGRVLEAEGFRVALLCQPDWRSADPWRELGRPRLFYAVSAGNMDSMINHYTANRKRRGEDAYSPGGRIELRPDRATNVYAQRCREAHKGVPVVIGGVEASLRRIAHYDYWSETVRPSILVSSKADLLGFGMGEKVIVAVAKTLAAGGSLADLRGLRGTAHLLGKKEELSSPETATVELPAFEEVREDARAFAVMTRDLHNETSPFNGRRLVQRHGDRTVVINPPELPLEEPELDRVYDLPYTRLPHPRYIEPIPAWEMIKDSITIMRGCFGGCTFCSITMHQGRTIQSRSEASILKEARGLTERGDFKGTISDIGGPTANMYRMRCTKPEVEKICRRLSCIHPKICKLLGTDHRPTIDLMRSVRELPGVERVNVQSGVRTDLAVLSPEYLEDLTAHHVGGHLKVAPEHTSSRPRADEEARDRGLRRLRGGLRRGLTQGGQGAVPGPLLHREPPRLDGGRHDPPRGVPQGPRLPAPAGAGLHPRADGHRHLHVLHRPGPRHPAAGRDCEEAPRPEDPAGPDAVLQARELVPRAGGPGRGGP